MQISGGIVLMDSFARLRRINAEGPPQAKKLYIANQYLRTVWQQRNDTARGRLILAWVALAGWSVAIVAIVWGAS